MKLSKKDQRRFMDSLGSDDSEKCWAWNGTKNNAGYPLFSLKGEMVSALRLLYRIYYNRRIPKTWIVSHTCRNNGCVNPNHIYITTRSERTKQAYQNRELVPASQKGEKNPNSKLTEQDIIDIRQRKKEGATHMELAEEYQVTKTTISQIVNRKLWAHVA
ncbi:MAG TPA: HNH endonuclease [bacterium]|nr:HNH endonuclease [bacterium]